MVGSRVLEVMEASAALHRYVVSPHRIPADGEDVNEDGVHIAAAEDAAPSSVARVTSSQSKAAAQTAAAAAGDAAAASASTDTSRERTSSANSRGGKRAPKRQAIARRTSSARSADPGRGAKAARGGRAHCPGGGPKAGVLRQIGIFGDRERNPQAAQQRRIIGRF